MSQDHFIRHGALRIELADRFLSRAKGLLFRKSLATEEGLLITPCSSIHTFGMRFAIDVFFLDAGGTVQRIERQVVPNRVSTCRRAHAVLELAAGAGEWHGIKVGDRIDLNEIRTASQEGTSS